MMWLFAVLIVVAMGAIAMIASGRGGAMDVAYSDRPDLALPTGRPLAATDLRTVRFPLALRGYRMSDVDDLLARLAAEMEHAGEVTSQHVGERDDAGDDDASDAGESA